MNDLDHEIIESNNDQIPVNPLDPELFRNLLKGFNQAMTVVCVLSLLLVYGKWGVDYVLPCALSSVLVWGNMIALAFGVRGVFNQQRSLVAVLLLKFGILLGGVYALSQLFPEQQISLLIGCSTWIVAISLIGKVGSFKTGVSVAILCISMTASPSDAKVTEAEMLEGEVDVVITQVKDSPMPQITAVGIIKSNLNDIWSIITDCGNFKHTMKNILDSKYHGVVNGKKRCEVTVDLPWPISNLRSMVDVKITERKDGVKIRNWSLVEGDYHKNSGEWRLTPRKDGYTLVKYTVHVEPKVSIPDWIQRSAQKSKIPDIFENLSEILKKRGKLLP